MTLPRGNGLQSTVYRLPQRTLQKGFTIIELMVVMTVIAILATMALYGLNNAQAAARDSARQQIMTGMQTALERYYGDKQGYPNISGARFDTLIWTLCYQVSRNYNQGALCDVSAYLTAVPKDPKSSCTGAVNAGGAPWTPCGNNTVPVYDYTSPDGVNCVGKALPDGYQLTLTKESGGKTYFCSPQ